MIAHIPGIRFRLAEEVGLEAELQGRNGFATLGAAAELASIISLKPRNSLVSTSDQAIPRPGAKVALTVESANIKLYTHTHTTAF